MRKHFLQRFIITALLVLTTPGWSMAAGGWPQFQGPNRDGISSESGLATQWPKDGPRVLWSCDVGIGFGGASIFDDKVYLLDREDDQRDVLRWLDLKTGKELGRFEHQAPGRLSHNGSRSNPTVDEKRIYAVGPFGNVYCVDRHSGKPLWNLELQKEFGSKVPNWGFSQSPLLVKDLVIVAPMSDQAGLAALQQETGKVVWRTESIGGRSYSSPTLRTILNTKGILFITREQVVFVDPANGKMLWKYDGYSCRIPIPFPTPLDNGRIFITGGYKAGSVMIRVSRNGDKFEIEELFRLKDHGSQIHPALFYDGHLYANFNTNENLKKNPDGLVCYDPSGNVNWMTKDNPDINRGSLLIADGMIYILDGINGELILARANPQKYEELDRAKIFEGGKKSEIWSPMALSDGLLVVRDQHEMKCLYVGQ